MKLRDGISKIDTTTKQKHQEPMEQSWSFEKVFKTDRPLASLTKMEKIHMSRLRDRKGTEQQTLQWPSESQTSAGKSEVSQCSEELPSGNSHTHVHVSYVSFAHSNSIAVTHESSWIKSFKSSESLTPPSFSELTVSPRSQGTGQEVCSRVGASRSPFRCKSLRSARFVQGLREAD